MSRFFSLAHADHIFCCPLSSSKADGLVELLDLTASSRVLDVGCGKAEFLIRTVERYAAAAVGVDPHGEFLQAARSSAEARGVGARVEWHEARIDEVSLQPASFDAALCLGSSHAFGNYRQALAALGALLRPGGQGLIGDLYWRKEPAPEYRAFLGATAEHLTHGGNEAAGLAVGLVPLYSCTSSEDEWDVYEGLFCRAVERFVRNNPHDPDAQPFVQRIRTWRENYRNWGRDTLGFGFYLFRKE